MSTLPTVQINAPVPAPVSTGRDRMADVAPVTGNNGNDRGSSSNDSHNSSFGDVLKAKSTQDAPQAASAPSKNNDAPAPKNDVAVAEPVNNTAPCDKADAVSTQSDEVIQVAVLVAQVQVTIQTTQSDTTNSAAQTDETAGDDQASSLQIMLQQLSVFLEDMLARLKEAMAKDAEKASGNTDDTQAADASSNKKKDPQTEALMELLAAILGQLKQDIQPTTKQADTQNDDAVGSVGETSQKPQPSLASLMQELLQLLRGNKENADGEEGDAAAADANNGDQKAVEPGLPKQVKNAPVIVPQLASDNTQKKDAQSKEPVIRPEQISEIQTLIDKAVRALTAKADTTDTLLAPAKQDDATSTKTDATPAVATTHAPVNTQGTHDVQRPAAPTPARAQILEQVVVQVKQAAQDGVSQIRIQLHPEDLGKVDVQLTTTADGKTSVSIASDNRNTLAMLQNEARSLQDALRDIGLKTDAGSLSFNLRDPGQDARNSSKQSAASYTKVAGVEEVTDDYGVSTAGALYRLSVVQGLDIRV